jgi:3-phenylpropionate/trans-cinnamate dioxygenase ferredoxin subunit
MIELGSIDIVAPGTMKRVDIDDHRYCIMNIGGVIYAIDDTCSHAEYSLSEGELDVDAKEVECPKHGALFDVTTGDPRSLPATRPVQTYNVVVEDGRMFLDVNAPDAASDASDAVSDAPVIPSDSEESHA